MSTQLRKTGMDLRAGAGGSPIMIRCKGKKKRNQKLVINQL